MRSRIYLAGPPFAEEYRRRAAVLLLAAGLEPVDPMRRDYRGNTEGHETEIVAGDLVDIDACDAVLAAFTAPDEGTAMEAWYAHSRGKPVVAYTGGSPVHPWTVIRRGPPLWRRNSGRARTRFGRQGTAFSAGAALRPRRGPAPVEPACAGRR